jgi:hypothetical protein
MRITIEDYMMGRDSMYPGELNDDIEANAEETVRKVNSLLAVMEAEGVLLEANPKTQSLVSSGWRPPQINGQVKNAAPKSKHMTAQAVDLYDPEGALDDFCTGSAQAALASIGLWMEHPAFTKGWCHLQIVAPRSGQRVFYP